MRFSNSPARGGRGSFAGAYRRHGPRASYVMRDMDVSEDPAALVASLRLLFDTLVRLPTDDPLKCQTRAFLARILDILENGPEAPAGQVPS